MSALAHQRCFNHAQREAAARCPACGRHYCRECVTEHDDRLLCTACLRATVRRPSLPRRGLTGLTRFARVVFGLFAAWFFFYLVGEILLALPTPFHEGTFWSASSGSDIE
jgi:hypothetical protein